MPPLDAPPPGAIFPHKGGYNSLKNRDELAPEETDDMENVWGDGEAAGKRPGMTLLKDINLGVIYDMVRHSMVTTDGTPGRAPDSFYMLVRATGDAGYPHVVAYSVIQNAITDIGKLARDADTYFDAEMVPASKDLIQITSFRKSPATGAQMLEIAGSTYALGANAMQSTYRVAAWHANVVIGTWSYVLSKVHEMGWSDFDDPRTYDAESTNEIRPLGRLDEVNGIISVNEVAYFIKSRSIWAMFGAIDEVWELHRISSGIGGFSSRACCDAEGAVLGIAVEQAMMGPTSDQNERAYPNNIFAIVGSEVNLIGDKVRPTLEALYTTEQGIAGLLDVKNRKAVYWQSKRTALFFPKIPLEVAQTSIALAYYGPGQTWWKWTFGTTELPNAPVYHNRLVYVGGGDGKIHYFDEAASDDGGSDFVSQITSPRLYPANRNHEEPLEAIDTAGVAPSSGTHPTLWVSREEDAFVSLGVVTLGVTVRTNVDGAIQRGKYYRIRYVFHADSVGPKVRWYLPVFGTGAAFP